LSSGAQAALDLLQANDSTDPSSPNATALATLKSILRFFQDAKASLFGPPSA
jgi:hypothetical protein